MIDFLDVSMVQHPIRWDRVAEATVAPGVDRRWRGVVVKCTEGLSYRDPHRLTFLDGARQVGLRTGVYHFLHPKDEVTCAADGLAVAQRIWNACGATMPDLPVALDVEAADAALTATQLVERVLWCRDGIASLFGRCPLFYTYPNFFRTRLAGARADLLAELAGSCPLWLAFYGAGTPWYPRPSAAPAPLPPWREITMWQYSGNTVKVPGAWDGRVPGIGGDVDRNLFLGDEGAFRQLCGLPPELPTEPEPIVHPQVPLGRPGLDE